ncbi:phenylalanine--tRNA ligase subunit alpha, partial [Bacteroidota bacterium]
MKEKLESLKNEITEAVVKTKEDLEHYRLKFISRKGVFNELFTDFKSVPNEEKRQMGQTLNEVKSLAHDKFHELLKSFDKSDDSEALADGLDLSLPPTQNTLGSVHPITAVRQRINEIFERIGFNISEGPEIEDDWHNFTALNFPENHPAREMQDTFFIEKNPDIALRTHTSSVQIRVMENQKPPIRTLSPGRVFR